MITRAQVKKQPIEGGDQINKSEKVIETLSDEDRQQRAQSNELSRQLNLVLANRDLKFGSVVLETLQQRRRKDITRLCELVLQPGVSKNRFCIIQKHPEEALQWFEEMTAASTALQATDNAAREYDAEALGLVHTAEAYDAAVDVQSDALLAEVSPDDDEFALVNERIKLARAELKSAHRRCAAALEARSECENAERAALKHPLDITDQILLANGPIADSRESHSSVDGEGAGSNKSASTQSYAVKKPPKKKKKKKKKKKNIVKYLRRLKKNEVFYYRDEFFHASKVFHRVRADYSDRLASFYIDKLHGEHSGTRTEFDQRYFLERANRSQEYKAADEKLWLTLAEAEKIGAMESSDAEVRAASESASEHAVDVDDRGVDGQGDFNLDAHLKSIRKEQIEIWRADDAQKEIASEGQWEAMLCPRGQEALTVAGIDGLNIEWATGKRRKAIDEWEAHRQELQSRAWPGLLPSSKKGNNEVSTESRSGWVETWGWSRPADHVA